MNCPKKKTQTKEKELRRRIHQNYQAYLKKNEVGLLEMKNIVIKIKNSMVFTKDYTELK